MSLSYTSLPYEGVVQITIDSGTKNVCWQSLKNQAKDIVCRHLGYYHSPRSFVNISTPTDAKNATFSGSIKCNGKEKYLSQCSINASASQSCSELSYIQCKYGKMKRIENIKRNRIIKRRMEEQLIGVNLIVYEIQNA